MTTTCHVRGCDRPVFRAIHAGGPMTPICLAHELMMMADLAATQPEGLDGFVSYLRFLIEYIEEG